MAQDPTSFADSLNIGDRVQVIGGKKRVKQLQVGHGGWVDTMANTIGKKGNIARLYQDGDVRVEVNGVSWTYNPACLRVTERAPSHVPPPVYSPIKTSTYSYPPHSRPKQAPLDPPKKVTTPALKQPSTTTPAGEKPSCIVCFEDFDDDQHKVIAFVPCGHTSCFICSKKMSQCHVCRKPIASKIPILFTYKY